MQIDIIESRLKEYNPADKHEETNAFKEIAQEIALRAFSRSDFFKKAAFQGGTCLRILYGLPRFSEDLDFILQQSATDFAWQTYFNELILEFEAYGLEVEVKDRSDAPGNIKKAFLKQNSLGKVIDLHYQRSRSDSQSITIKLEIDTNPPAGSEFEIKLIDFPTPFSIIAQQPTSLFASKLHALLCRPYVKGRDWYDFVWYVTRKTNVNHILLKNALYQQGPWQGQSINIDNTWLKQALHEKVNSIDWDVARNDVSRFLKPADQDTLALWGEGFFVGYVERLSRVDP